MSGLSKNFTCSTAPSSHSDWNDNPRHVGLSKHATFLLLISLSQATFQETHSGCTEPTTHIYRSADFKLVGSMTSDAASNHCGRRAAGKNNDAATAKSWWTARNMTIGSWWTMRSAGGRQAA